LCYKPPELVGFAFGLQPPYRVTSVVHLPDQHIRVVAAAFVVRLFEGKKAPQKKKEKNHQIQYEKTHSVMIFFFCFFN